MSTTEHLPVYKASYDMTLTLFQVIKHYPRDLKFTIGEQIKHDSLALIATIYRANASREKSPIIQEAKGYLHSVRVMCRLSKDLHVIPLERFVSLQECLEVISKQLSGWERSVL
jgi:23S rRNA-intervening sequence protein